MTRLSGPKPVRFRLHIDHLDNPDRDVWALRFGRQYLVARHVQVHVPIESVFRPGKRQPRAWLAGEGAVWQSEDGSFLEVRVE